ncbi:hypothetical protein [Thermoproteus tenax]|uniref:Uncharacterized protein n=1 Tax=Thermoproteus tenax (strain ATCC 35583 / DSM 2078 / JCM 9277 / NBRC 100435 / Kra 1) TaxID=768679 RepID=G4RPC6_THETK|nr:hypothetical protein [Thermoproteus tenax]CCC81421.1 hypothetical protein TTX_0766 [Thermoproteus tenax Kra 1]
MRLWWIGAALIAASLLPSVHFVAYATGPNPTISLSPGYLIIGSARYSLPVLPRIVSIATSAIALAGAAFLEIKRGVRARATSASVALVALILALPIPIIISEQGGLTVVLLSNAFAGASALLFLIGVALEATEHHIAPQKSTKLLAEIDMAINKTQKT